MSRAALALLLVLGLGACDGAFEPTFEGGPAAALFGSLDGRVPRQVLRVQALGTAVIGTPDALPLTVTSTELGSGRTATWRDSVVTLASGERAHLFVADLAVAPGETHRVEAVRSPDGARSAVDVRLPSPRATPGSRVGEQTIPVRVEGLPGRATDPALRYRARRADGSAETVFAVPTMLQAEGDARTFQAFLGNARLRAEQDLYGEAGGDVVLVEARLEAVVFSIGGVAVEEGFGEVGWVVPVAVAVPFSAEALADAGFVVVP